MEEERPSRTRPRLGQGLRGQAAEREARIDDVGGQLFGGRRTAADDLAEADLLGLATPSSISSNVLPS
jgi:hypothetical protein